MEAHVCTVVVFFCFCATGCLGGLGKCPLHDTIRDFNITRFLGRWYEVERAFYFMELTIKCLAVDISVNKRGQIVVTAITQNKWSEKEKISEGIITPTKRDASILYFKVLSTLPNTLTDLLPGVARYQVLDTDYDNYAVIWSCISYGLFHVDRLWIWGRKREINVETRSKIYIYLTDINLDPDKLVNSNNRNCTTPTYKV